MESWQSYFSARIFYYSAQSLLLGGFLTFYGVDAFMDRDPCLTDDSQQINVARRFTHLFKVCFYLHLTQFLTSASAGPLVDILLPMKQNHEGQSYDTIMKEAGSKAQTTIVMIFEHILRAAVLVMAFWQWGFLRQEEYSKCLNDEKELAREAMMMAVLLAF